jgi:uncharacterized membrane protein YcaP (DUF421 family)
VTDQLTTTPSTAVQVVVATVAIYLAFVLLLRLAGPRSLATLSLSDLAFVMALGALVGRTTLLADPSLVTGLLALTTLFVLQRVMTLVQRHGPWRRRLHRTPVVLVRDGRLLVDAQRRARVHDDELREALRHAGVVTLADVAWAVLEPTGRISVLRGETPLDPWLVVDLDRESRPGPGQP